MKYALHIGINSVDPKVYNGWDGQLNACEKDAKSMAQLAAKEGYQTAMLLTKEATMKQVLCELRHYASLAIAGDTILLTYSGHGGQIPDDSGDEKDGLDETWVLYDGMIVDDMLHQTYASFRKGVRIIVLSDSCHSGTVIKRVRFGAEGIEVGGKIKSAPDLVCREYAGTLPAPVKINRPRIKASMVLISGCQDNQFSYDGDENGQFTGTLLKVYDDGKCQLPYKEFRKAIVKKMPPEQTPQFLRMGGRDKLFESSKVFSGI